MDFVKDDERYLIFIAEYKLKNGVSPFVLEKDRMRNTIINKRKLDLLEDMRSSLFTEAISKGDIEILSIQ